MINALTEGQAGQRLCHRTVGTPDAFNFKCMGAHCMAWRWVPEGSRRLHPASTSQNPQHVDTVEPHVGYCGLVSAP